MKIKTIFIWSKNWLINFCLDETQYWLHPIIVIMLCCLINYFNLTPNSLTLHNTNFNNL